MNWLKFWEWDIWKEDEPAPLPLPMTDESKTLAIDEPPTEEELCANPAAARIRESLLAVRQ